MLRRCSPGLGAEPCVIDLQHASTGVAPDPKRAHRLHRDGPTVNTPQVTSGTQAEQIDRVVTAAVAPLLLVVCVQPHGRAAAFGVSAAETVPLLYAAAAPLGRGTARCEGG